MKKLEKYICVRDLQGGSFAVGRVLTTKEWLEQALEWCYQDDNEEYARFLKKIPKKDIIGEIASVWDLQIIPIEDLPLQEMWDLFDFIDEIKFTILGVNVDKKDELVKQLVENAMAIINKIYNL